MSDPFQQTEIELTVSNAQGLHARPVMKFVDTAGKFSCSIRVRKDDLDVDGKSAMEMMLLAAGSGTRLKVAAAGPDAAEALQALRELVDGRFGEE